LLQFCCIGWGGAAVALEADYPPRSIEHVLIRLLYGTGSACLGLMPDEVTNDPLIHAASVDVTEAD
jgi:hypothetical protein